MMRFLPWLSLTALLAVPIGGHAGQTAADHLVTRLTGVPVTAFFDLDARLDTLEAGVPAAEVTYTPADTNDWPGADPALVSSGLDTLADRITALETAAAKGRLVTVTVGAEAANVIALTVEVNDLLGVDAAGPVRTQVRLFEDVHYLTAANPGMFPVTDGGDGTVESTNMAGSVSVICLTGASTRNQLNVTDSGGASGTALYGYVDVLAGTSPVVSARVRFTLTFDGV